MTLLVLLGLAALVGVGPAQLRELVSGVLFVRPQAATIAPAPPHLDSSLQARVESISGGVRSAGRLAVAAVDLQSGATASFEGSQSYPAASLFKLPILMQVLALEDAGQLDPERQVEIRADDWTDGSGVLQARIGDRLSVRELTQLMIAQSDNIAALVLLDVIGVPAANSMAQQLGLDATHVVDHRAGEAGDHVTSANDMAHLMEELATGQAVNQRVSEHALSLLELKQGVTWLGDDLPFWVKVAHKWGDLPEARHDAGIVFTPRGSYAMAVLTQDSPPDEAAATIARASRVMYDYLGNR